ncbi:zinc finger CCCH-type with G patch domain-containing protein-like [Asterias amurensis]|uniref:zinc finger CCCH-type with G patch domain-containing protein-like n=1 Tax=Asterias amurensis TaxID=7602 RepID=UPI003AB6D4B5
MDEENLQATIVTYKQQLQQVEVVLLSAGTEGQTELLQLREDLREVVQLTEESLLSLKKSKLLSLVDTATESTTSGSCASDASLRDQPSRNNASSNKFDEEFAAFQAAIAEDDNVNRPSESNVSTATSSKFFPARVQDETGTEETRDGEEEGEEEEEEDISGTKCSVDYVEEWGGRQRHNAVVMCVEPRVDGEEASLRVLFCNPTSLSMKPCPYYLEGSCRFAIEDCRFSHGYIVKLSEIHSFKEPDFSLLKLEAPCLARYNDGVWYPASIQHIDEDKHQVTVQYESYGTTATLDVQSVLPSEQRSDTSPPLSSSSEDSEDEELDVPSTSSSRQDTPTFREESPSVGWRPSGGGVPLGEWEAHTRGIGSKLMALMGYEFGKGLGRHGEGRVEPVEAVIVPQGKSLDKCMELREMKKLGIVGKQKKKKRKVKGHHHHGDAGGQPRKKENVFDFLNQKLGGKKTKISDLIQMNVDSRKFLEKEPMVDKDEEKPNRKLNIQLVKAQEDIRSTEKRLARLQQSLQRNQSDKLTSSQIKAKITGVEQLLHNLRSTEGKIKRQQSTRQQHKKLTVF